MTIFRSERPRKRRFFERSVAVIVVLLAIGFVSVVVVRGRSFDDTTSPDLQAVRDLPVTMPDGHPAHLGDLIKPDRPTVINLWASWCGPCRSEGPHLAELRRRFGPDRLNLVALNVRDEAATAEDREAFLKAVGLPAKNYAILDSSRIAALTNARSNLVPRTLIFAPSGAPIGTITGYKPMALARIAGLIE